MTTRLQLYPLGIRINSVLLMYQKTGLETELDSLMSERAVVLADELEQAKVSGIPFDELEPMYMDERIEEVMSEIHDLQSRIGVLQNVMESVASQLDANASQVAGKLDYNVAREVSTSLVKSLDIEEAALLFETLIDEIVELKSFKATQAPHSAYLEAGTRELTGGICTMYQTISRSVQLARTAGIENTGVMSDLVQLYQQVSQAYSKARNVDLAYREATPTATKPSSPPSSIPRSCSMLTLPTSNSGLPTPSHSIPHANNPNTPAPSSIKSAR